MNQELEEKMMKVAKEVNKKYEQIALEEAKKEGIKEGERKGKKKGKDEEKKEIAKKLKELLTPEEIEKITGLSLQTILLL